MDHAAIGLMVNSGRGDGDQSWKWLLMWLLRQVDNLFGRFCNLKKISSIVAPRKKLKLYKIDSAIRLINLSSHHGLGFFIFIEVMIKMHVS